MRVQLHLGQKRLPTRFLDLLPRLKPWDSPKGSSRLRVSSARKYAFGWGVQRWPLGYDPERAFQRVQPGQTGLPTRTRRALRREYRFPPRSGIQPTGYHHSRPARRPGRGGLVLRLCYPAGCGREASVGVEDPVPQPGNAVTMQYGRKKLAIRDTTPDWLVGRGLSPHRVGFIPRLKPWAFASNKCEHRTTDIDPRGSKAMPCRETKTMTALYPRPTRSLRSLLEDGGLAPIISKRELLSG